jgi:hypothetical protein
MPLSAYSLESDMGLGLKGFAGALLASSVGLLFSSGAALANAIVSTTYTDAVPQGSTDWSSVISIPKFNPALGKLLSVQVNLTGTLNGSIQVANTKTFNGDIVATGAVPAHTGWTNSSHSAHCTASSTTCTIWNITYKATPPAIIPTSTINSVVSATITMHVGSNVVVVLPAASETNTFDSGPKYNPATYTFTKQYGNSNGSSAPIAKSAALAKTISSTGIQSPGEILAPGLANPCDEIYGPCTVGSTTYNVGMTYAELTASDSAWAKYVTPADLALFEGLGSLLLPVDAFGASKHDGGANVDFKSTADAGAEASFVYTYIDAPEPITLGLFGAGIAAAGLIRRRRREKTQG